MCPLWIRSCWFEVAEVFVFNLRQTAARGVVFHQEENVSGLLCLYRVNGLTLGEIQMKNIQKENSRCDVTNLWSRLTENWICVFYVQCVCVCVWVGEGPREICVCVCGGKLCVHAHVCNVPEQIIRWRRRMLKLFLKGADVIHMKCFFSFMLW